MQEEEAKKIARESPTRRLALLVRSATGIMAVIGVLLGVVSGYLTGFNEEPRLVLYQKSADDLRNQLTQSKQDIGVAVKSIGFDKLTDEAQKKLYSALQRIDAVSEALKPQVNDKPAIFLPRFLDFSALVSPAYAQSENVRSIAKEDFRQNLAMGLLFAITVFWVFCLGVYFLSKDEKKIAFAANMIQTVLGFYIGVFTGLMGLPVTAG